MKVKDLIEKLNQCNQEHVVMFRTWYDHDAHPSTVGRVLREKETDDQLIHPIQDGVVWLCNNPEFIEENGRQRNLNEYKFGCYNTNFLI